METMVRTKEKPGETVEEVLKRISTTGRAEERKKFTKTADGTVARNVVSLWGAKCGEVREFQGKNLPEAVIAAYDWADARKIRIDWKV